MYGFIYVIENNFNGKLYVGQTVDPVKRWSKHCSEKSHSYAIYNAIQKHGKDNFDFVFIEACESLEQLNTCEQFWIETLGTISPTGYNLKEGGGSSGKCSLETRLKISESKKGRKWSLKERQERAKSNYCSNKTHCLKGHHYDSDNTYIRPNGHRMCRTCHRERERLRKRRHVSNQRQGRVGS